MSKVAAKRQTMAAMEGGASELAGPGSPSNAKRKNSLSNWNKFKTVSWRVDHAADYEEHTSVVLAQGGVWAQLSHEYLSWLIPGAVGIATATSGAIIERNVEWFGAWRFGYCPTAFFWSTNENCKEDWISYEDKGDGSPSLGLNGYGMFIFVSSFIACISATLTWGFAPRSRGSGIPEIKTILGGFTFGAEIKDILDANTLFIKIIGLSMSVGAGLSCGKEGPLVHIACCWSNVICKFFARYRDNEAKQRELVSAACAAGVAVAFGAPLGGVLFSYEEASTVFPNRTMLRSFFASSVAAMTLAWWNVTGTGMLTMFNCPYVYPPAWIEYIAFIAMGLVGGLIGALFCHYNIQIMKFRADGTWFRSKCHIVLEVTLISFVTAVTSYHLLWTKIISNVAIRGMFHDCKMANATGLDMHEWMLDLCDPDDTSKPGLGTHLMGCILLTGFLRWAQMCITFGTGAAAGLFIPSLLTGAALGRVVGMACYIANEKFQLVVEPGTAAGVFVNGIHPGMYSMLGAAGVLGGVCRVTISLVVIMFELTGGLQLIVPFMVVCTLAKWVGDYYTIGIYDYIILVRKYPYLHEPDEEYYTHNSEDVMDVCIDCFHPDVGTIGKLIQFLEKPKTHGGYPLTQAERDPTLLGYVHTVPLVKFLNKYKRDHGDLFNPEERVCFKKFMDTPPKNMLDISRYCDEAVMTTVKETKTVELQKMFRNLGLKVILVRERAFLVGMITKKSFIKHMEEVHELGHADIAKGQLQDAMSAGLREPLLPR